MNKQIRKVVLITGGSSGLGFELGKQMCEAGDTVIVCGRSKDKLDTVKKLVPKLITFPCDITKSEDREKLLQFIKFKFKNLNMLINNAGIAERYLLSKVTNLEEKLHREISTNYIAPVMLADMFKEILSTNRGTVVNVTSGLAYVPAFIEPNYCATKAALHSMTQSMRLEYAKLNIKVSEIFYPAVDTPFQNGHVPPNAIKADLAASVALNGLNRGKEEIRVKMAGMLYVLSRVIPKGALKMINSFIPDNVEVLLVK